MTDEQWQRFLAVIEGKPSERPTAAFIIDCPWLPNWAGMSLLDYFSSESMWLDANFRAIETFPEIVFLPGFWSEYGMCTEPSAFGAKCVFHENEFPFAHKLLDMDSDFGRTPRPDPRTDGLAPFVLRRLVHVRPRIEAAGHRHRFAVARGPLNIAGFLMGNTEFLTAMKLYPDQTHALLDTISAFLVDWLQLQKRTLPSIDGILLLDDIAGFIGPDDFRDFAEPRLRRCFAAFDCAVRFFHNDALGTVCAPRLADIGVNLFNFSHEHPMAEMQRLVGDQVALLGNIPPRDVLSQGTPDDVRQSVAELLAATPDRRRILYSCGGGMPPSVSTENLRAFLDALG